MPRVMVCADDGWVALEERVTSRDFESELFRRHLAERLAWAAADAERFAAAPDRARVEEATVAAAA